VGGMQQIADWLKKLGMFEYALPKITLIAAFSVSSRIKTQKFARASTR
jgi:hypothetical protein